ncbi:RdgB/HAM1 family non-canonical purine NTP pyrophosphatase [Leptospira sp. GIMC2001]|uniref:RdgB/HAM1 family non-canonical purine NTP pyrophosphatase n=1 Tax=Leptospira sp. GIMC2001 TaxID=1513297 RepID=UPI002349D76E|nr:RdgB/HAM1 family non-canonical purine NTP pyrophosphatase [Leptospira sp. GIMC2001]WCL50419.1 RdgB/HAM1 family non-canonical purine NTP pyrophosphatase [Leptospira sp. GIMC2001]
MKRKLAIATGNKHKLIEIQALLQGLEYEISNPSQLGIENFAPIEDGSSFQENAKIKSESLFQLSGELSLADDSGICVEALDGRPGIHSARYGGIHLQDFERNELLLSELIGCKNRNAKFVSVIAFTDSNGTQYFTGEVHGIVAESFSGKGGFGYDPIFYYPQLGKTFAELSAEEKNRISHRAIALDKFKKFIIDYSTSK